MLCWIITITAGSRTEAKKNMQTSCAPKKRLMTFITLRLNYMLRESLIIPYLVNPSSWLTFFIFLVNKILTAVCSLLRTEGSVTQSTTNQLCLNLTKPHCCNYKNPYQGCREGAEWVLPTEWQFSTIIFLWLNTLQKILCLHFRYFEDEKYKLK